MARVEEEVAQLRRELSAAQQQQGRAQAELATAQANAEATTRALREEFGVDTLEAARTLQASLESDLADELAHVREQLARAGNQG